MRMLWLWICAFAAMGCSRDLQFRVVDSVSGLPLAGVTVEKHSRQSDLMIGDKWEHVRICASRDDGTTQPITVRERWMSTIAFSKKGYYRANVLYPASSRENALVVSPVQADDNPDGERQFLTKVQGVIDVPMAPCSTAQSSTGF